MELTFAELTESPIGTISFMAGETGLKKVSFCALSVLKNDLNLRDAMPSLQGLNILGQLLAEMKKYLLGQQKDFTIAIDWNIFGGFQSRVLEMTAKIPYGEVLTYGDIARRLSMPKAARAVGNALRSNPVPIVIPCHRVIGSDGGLAGYIGGLERKAYLLRLEGHTIKKNELAAA